MGRGIEMIRDPATYKNSLLTKEDKWGEPALSPEEVKFVLESPSETILAAANGLNDNDAPEEEE